MRPMLFAFICLFFSLDLSAGIAFFEGSYEEALELAKKEKKIIFIDAYASWCGPCKRMAKNVFTQDAVGDFYNEHFINLKLDMEKAEAEVFRKSFSVSAFPTLFYIDGKEELVHKLVGGQDGAGLISAGEVALSKLDVSKDLAKEYEEGNRDPEFVLEYVIALNASGKNSLPVANKYLMSQKDLNTDFNLKFIYEANTACDSRIFTLFEKRKESLESMFGEEEVQEKIASACKATVRKAIEFESEDLLEEAKEKYKRHYSKKEAGSFALNADMDYSYAQGNLEGAMSAAEKLTKSYYKGNAEAKYELAKKMMRMKENDLSFVKLIMKIAESSTEDSDELRYWSYYHSLLVKFGENEKAEEVLSKIEKMK